ncbi:hypothetical protein [Marinovum algicola]|uniref:hypothetical protein n=1 Tax=Marinovum algicola TaxID=42444 RepID=UPI003B5229E7
MLTIETQVTGAQVARQLCDDDEEMAFALAEMAERRVQGAATGISEYLPYGSTENVVTMLRELADYIENEGKLT